MSDQNSLADWQPDQYLRFLDERTQPTVDLAGRVDIPSPARIMDLGCGPGNSTAVLAARWPEASILGVDSSESMLAKAARTAVPAEWMRHDASQDMTPLGTFDLIFSNAVLQWIPDTRELLPRLFAMLNPGGMLAVQIPYTRELPAFRAIQRLIALDEWKEWFAEPVTYPLHHPYEFYYDILCGMRGRTVMWQTEYIHIMADHDAIVEWYKGSALRPFLNRIPDEARRERFLALYAEDIRDTYHRERDGSILFPFPRIFFLKYTA